MFKKIILAMGILIMPTLLVLGCSANAANQDKPSLGEEFRLPAGQSVTISSEDLTIKFVAVTADSRSPKGVQTIWAGEAKAQLQVTYQGSVSTVTLTESGGTDGYTQDSFGPYKVSFRLLPYPEVGKQPAAGDYDLLMTVSK